MDEAQSMEGYLIKFDGKIKNGDLTKHIRIKAVPKKYKKPRFIIQQKGTWWKALVMIDRKNRGKEIVCLKDGKKISANYIPEAEPNEYMLSIAEAKELGIHTNMYAIGNFYDFGRDHDWYFSWE